MGNVQWVLERTEVPLIDDAMKERFQTAKSEEERQKILSESLDAQVAASEQKRMKIALDIQANISKVEEVGLSRNYKMVLVNQKEFLEQNIEVLKLDAPDAVPELEQSV